MTTAARNTIALLALCLATTGALHAADKQNNNAASEKPTLHVSPEGDGPFTGRTGAPIRAALNKLPESGGTVLIEPGTYLVRSKIVLPENATLRGSNAASVILRFPAPTLITSAASKGDRTIAVAKPDLFAPDTTVQIIPPKGTDRFDALENKTKSATIEAIGITSIEGNTITLARPLPVDLPKSSRVGYAHNLLSIRKPTNNVTVENITLEGGRTDAIPMPGHAKRSAIWASSPYTYAKGPQQPPVRNLTVRHCIIRDFYGRAVAMYNVADSAVIGCHISRIPDDAINFDHFNFNNRALGNTVTDARIGVTLNDASRCTVRYNRLERCNAGVQVWWWHKVDPEGVNEHNTIEHNTILKPRGVAVSLSKNAFHNTVRHNFVEGPVKAAEKNNTLEHNTHMKPDAQDTNGDS